MDFVDQLSEMNGGYHDWAEFDDWRRKNLPRVGKVHEMNLATMELMNTDSFQKVTGLIHGAR